MMIKKLIGHEKIQTQLKKAIENKHISHAYIFQGSDGLGKKVLAYNLAQTLCCLNQGTEACKECEACVQIETQNSPDLVFIEPDGNSIKREQIDKLQKDLMVKPFGYKKVIIIESADMMTIQAQNTFLKTLEEPPAYAVIIMLVTNSYRLLPTILSRSQIISFYPLNKQIILEHIKENYKIANEEAELISNYSSGIIGKAIKNCEDDGFKTLRNEVTSIMESLIGGELGNIFTSAQFFDKKKEQINDIIEIVHLWLRDLMIIKSTGEHDNIINIDYSGLLYIQSQKLELQNIMEALQAVEIFQEDLKYNVNYLAAVDRLLFKIQGV